MAKFPIKITMVYQTNPFTEGQGGGVRYVTSIVRELAKQDVEITFLGVGGVERKEGNIHFIPVMRSSRSTLLFMLALLWARLKRLNAPYSVVHVHRLYFALPFAGKGIRCVATLHGRTFTVFPERFGKHLSKMVFPFFRRLERSLLQRTDYLVPVSSDVVEQFRARHGPALDENRMQIIPPMVDLDMFYPRSANYFQCDFGSAPVCVFVGRLAAVKNLPLLLESWKLVTLQRCDAKLVLIGDGELHEFIKKRIAELGLCETVTMLGEVKPKLIADLISSANMLIVTSNHESGPLVVKEALACGTPTVSTAVGEVAGIVDDGKTGRITSHDAAEIASAILDVLSWKTSKSAILEAAKPVLQRSSPQATANAYLEIYKSLIAKTRELDGKTKPTGKSV